MDKNAKLEHGLFCMFEYQFLVTTSVKQRLTRMSRRKMVRRNDQRGADL